MSLLLLAGACSSGGEVGGGDTTPATADFTVDFNSVITDDFAGFGTQYNNYLYTTRTYTNTGVTTANLPDLEQKVKNLKSQYVRIFFDRKCWEGQSGYNAEYMPSTVKVIELAQATNALVNITYWNTSNAAQMSAFADFIKKMLDDGMTCVKQVTIQNEVNDTGISQADYQASYRAFVARLVELGIRNKIQVVGGDLTLTNQASWFAYMADNMSDILDGYSSHIYWKYPDEPTKATDRLSGIMNIINAMPTGKKKPEYITEYGVRGVQTDGDPYKNPGTYQGTPICRTVVYATEHARFNIEALNYGIAGLVKWDCYKAEYDNTPQYHNLIGSGADGYPLYPGYHLYRLFTHSSASGWKVVKSNVNKVDAFKKVAAMKAATGNDMTVYAMNNSNGDIHIAVDGLPANKTFHTLVWNKVQTGLLTKGDDVTSDANGYVKLTVSARGLVAMTTLNPTL